MIATALTKLQTLGLPFAPWTIDRLALQEAKGIAMQRGRIDEILLHEGLLWRKHETWFGERVDPAFAEKGRIETLYTTPPAGSCVICLDEMGSVSAKSYAGRALVPTRPRPGDWVRQEIDYVAAPKAMSLVRFARPREKPSPIVIQGVAVHPLSTSWIGLRRGCRPQRSGSMRSSTI